MKHLSPFALLALLVVIITIATNGVKAYFELDEKLIGKPTKTILADGRVHLKFDEIKNKPFPEGVEFPSYIEHDKLKLSDDESIEPEPQDHHINFHGEAIMAGHWETFNLDEHTDASKIVCHDRGDKNMRLSVFGASAKLVDYLKNKKESVILHADANQHICHGDPIFRVVVAAHFFDSEILLVTSKASYEDIFEEAHVGFDIKHPKLTHITTERTMIHEEGEDHGVTPKDTLHAKNAAAGSKIPSSTFGSDAVPASTDRMNPRDTTEVNGHKINQEGWSIMEQAEQEPATALANANKEDSRSAKKTGWFKKLKKKIKKAVKKVVKRVVKTVKKAVSKVVKAVAKGIQSVVDKIKNLLTLTIHKKISKSLTAKKDWKKSIKGIIFTMDFQFYAGFKFELLIKTFKLYIFHASVGGSLNFGGAAELPRRSYANGGQSMLWDLKGPHITFAIGPVPVWISYSTRCLAAYSLSYSFWAKAGFRVRAGAQFGAEYTRASGFKMINNRYFQRTQSLEYDASFAAAPSLAAQGRFALYSMATAYAQLNMGLDVSLTTTDKTLFSKDYGPKTIANWKWQAINVCKAKGGRRSRGRRMEDQGLLALPSAAEAAELEQLEQSHHLLPQANLDGTPVIRNANVLSDDTDPITELDVDDSGAVWNTDFTCQDTNNSDINVSLTGFFDAEGPTVFFVTFSRNITVSPTNESNMTYSLAYQSALAAVESNVTLGGSYIFRLVAPTVENANDLGLDYEDIADLTDSAGDNLTNPLPIDWINITFGQTDMKQLSVANPAMCPPMGNKSQSAQSLNNNVTEPAAPPAGSYFGRMFADFGKSLFPAFIRLITDVLVVVLILATIEFILAYLAPRIIGHEHWPKTATTPRTREWVYMVVGMAVGFVCMVIFIVGANITFAEITGAQLAPNFTVPVKDQGEQSFLTASGVQTIVWKFNGASIELNKCPQYYPCSPDCRDLCAKQERSWTNAPWPFCPDTAVETDNGGCTKFAWDAVLNAIFFCVFLFILPVVFMKKCDTIYRRQICLHGSLMLAGMFLNLLWRRMDSFMNEVEIQMFDPADQMIIPFDLAINPTSNDTWKTAITLYWVMVGLISVGCGYDMYLFRKDTLEGKITRFDDGFESEGVEAKSYKNADDASNNNARPRANTDFAKDVAADLANLDLNTGAENKNVNEGELALM